MIKLKDMVCTYTLMARSIKVNGKTISNMAWDVKLILTVPAIKGFTRMEKSMDMVSSLGLTLQRLQEPSSKVNKKGSAFTSRQT